MPSYGRVVRNVLHWLECEMIGIAGMVAGTGGMYGGQGMVNGHWR